MMAQTDLQEADSHRMRMVTRVVHSLSLGITALLSLTVSSAFAETTKTVFNPFTGKLDYITSLSTTATSGTFILNTSTLQSGATFYVSSGTVQGQLTIAPTGNFGILTLIPGTAVTPATVQGSGNLELDAGGTSIDVFRQGNANSIPGPSQQMLGNLSVGGNALYFKQLNGTPGNNFISFIASQTVTTTQFVLPNADGTSGQFIQTDGAHNLSFASAAGGSSTLAVTTGTSTGFSSLASSPTSVALFDNTHFSVALQGGSTAYVNLLSTQTFSSMTVTNQLNITGANAGTIQFKEASSPGINPSTNFDTFWADSSSHTFVMNNNLNVSTYVVTGTSSTNTTGHMAVWSTTVGGLVDGGAPSAGGGTPAAPLNSVQFNKNSSFGGAAGFSEWTSSVTNSLGLGEAITYGLSVGTITQTGAFFKINNDAAEVDFYNTAGNSINSFIRGVTGNYFKFDNYTNPYLFQQNDLTWMKVDNSGNIGLSGTLVTGFTNSNTLLSVSPSTTSSYAVMFGTTTNETGNTIAISTNSEIVVAGSTGTSGQFLQSQGPGAPVKWASSTNQTITLSGDSTGSGTTAITVTATANQPNIKTLSASSTTIKGNFEIDGWTQDNGSMTISGAGGESVTYGVVAGSITLNNIATVPQCLHADSSGFITGTGSDCVSSGGVVVPSTFTWTMVTEGIYLSTNSVSTSYTITSTDTVVFASGTLTGNGVTTYTLPFSTNAFINNSGQVVHIIKVDGSTGTVRITTQGSDLIFGTTVAFTINAQGQYCDLLADNAHNWWPGPGGCQATPPRLYSQPFTESGSFTETASSSIAISPFYVPVPVAVMGFTYAATTNTGNLAFGILDSNGNVVMSTGPFPTGSSGGRSILTTPKMIPPGNYYIATQINNNTTVLDGNGTNAGGMTGCSSYNETAMGIVNVTLGTSACNATPAVSVLVAGGKVSFN